MKSKVDKKDYCILHEGDRFPYKLNKKKTDRDIASLIQVLIAMKLVMESIESESPDIWRFIREMALSPDCCRDYCNDDEVIGCVT